MARRTVTRREWMVATASLTVAFTPLVRASDGAVRVEETEPQAKALAYVHDASEVDRSRFPRFESTANCANCRLYSGTSGDWGPCAIFPGKQVSARGWCSAWVARG